MRARSKLLVALVLASAPSRAANNVSDEVSSNRVSATPGNPRSGSLSDSLRATFDVGEDWSVLAGVLITLEQSTPAPAGAAFGDRGGLVSTFSTGGEYHPGDNWSFGLSGDFSPRSTQRFGTQINITTTAGDRVADALLRATSASADLQFSVAYDSAGDSAVEWSLTGGATLSHISTDQRVAELQESNGNVQTTAAIARYCQTHVCSKALLQVIGPMPAATLDSARLSVGATLTLLQDTDVAIDADYYGYEQDPTQIGYFSLGTTGRTEIAGGAGVPIAPLRYLVEPEFTQRMGDFSARLWLRAGRYVTGTGGTTRGIGTKLQYKLTKALKMWASASLQLDVDSENDLSVSKTFSFGAGYKF
jgi:hypothetical protein